MVLEDNNGALTLATALKMTPWSKHIGIKYQFFYEHVKHKMVKIVYICSDLQKADLFMKGLPVPKFQTMHKLLMGW